MLDRLDRAHLGVAVAAARLRFFPWVTNDVGRRLYVDPSDKRAWRLARAGGLLDRPAIDAWRRLVRIVQPELVLDIGANYGEVLLSCQYSALVHAFEPNPCVAEHLQRSIGNGEVTLHRAAASDRDGVAHLHVQQVSSGLSSLESRVGTSIEVPAMTIDSIGLAPRRLLFKIDVEGHEPAVLRGMAGTLARAEQAIGLIEYERVIDLSAFAHQYRVRSADGAFVPLDDRTSEDPAGFTKDVVVSSIPLHL